MLHQSGSSSNIFGGSAGNFTLTSTATTAFGTQAGAALTNSSNNCLFGYQAGLVITTGGNNNAFGFQALFSNISGTDNTALGTLALQLVTGSQNIGIGRSSGANLTTGAQCVALGHSVSFPSVSANGQLNIQNFIYGFLNTGTGATVSTGRLAFGQSTDDGVTKIQIAGSVKANGYGSALVSKGVVGAAVTIDWTAGCIQTFTTTTATNCTLTFTAPNNPGNSLFLKVVAPAAGTTPTLTYPATVKGVPPATVTLAKVSMLEFVWDGTNYFYMSGCLNV
jgi:hypothetical protein